MLWCVLVCTARARYVSTVRLCLNTVLGLEDEDGTLQPPQPPALPLPLALPTLDLLSCLSGLLGPMEEVAVAAAATRQDGNIDRSSQVNESPAQGNKGAIALEGMVDRHFFLSWTSQSEKVHRGDTMGGIASQLCWPFNSP